MDKELSSYKWRCNSKHCATPCTIDTHCKGMEIPHTCPYTQDNIECEKISDMNKSEMSKKEFVWQINNIELLFKEEQKVVDMLAIDTERSRFFKKLYYFYDTAIDNLQSIMYDNNEWIRHYVYETRFGKQCTKVVFNNKTYYINTADKLYDIIIKTREE